MQQKSRILILSTAYLPHIGGSELAIKNITDRINNFEFDLITARLSDLPEYERIGNVNVFRVGGFLSMSKFILPKLTLPLAVFFKARSLLKQNDYKLIHGFQASGASGAGWLIKFFYPNILFVLTLQEGKDLASQGFLINFFRRLIIGKADYATAISNYLAGYVSKVNSSLKVKVIPNGVDFYNFSKDFSYGELADLEKSLGIQPDDKVIISVSRLVPKNGLDLLIEAVSEIKKLGNSEIKLLILGVGPLKKELVSSIKYQGLEDSVIFAGTIGQEELPKYLKISDVFVRPSRSEGLGSAFLEAMAAGVPIIGTKVGGIPDFLEDRKTGLFTKPEPKDIASKINIILENSVLRQEIIKNSSNLVREKYNWNNIADEFDKSYSSLR